MTTQAAASDYWNDIVAFAEREYILPQTGRPIVLLEHQKRILRNCFTRGADGCFPYQVVIYSAPKKSGKTEIAALVAEWIALTEGPLAEIYTPANDYEQSSSRVFRAVARSVQASHGLRSVKVQKDVIAFPDGTEIKALATDYAGVAGANPTLSVWDELWAYTSEATRRFWDELTPSPTRKNSLRLIVTYAGFLGESTLLEELYAQGRAGERLYEDLPVWVSDGVYMYWDTEPRMPWQTPEYYASQRRQLRQNAYRRMHLNEWVDPESSAVESAEWDALVGPDLAPYPQVEGRGQAVYVGVDASKGAKRGSDTTAAVATWREGDVVRLVAHRIWVPTGRGGDLDLRATLLPWLLDLKKLYHVGRVFYDPYQMATLAQIGRDLGLRMEELPQTQGRQTEFTTTLLDVIRTRNLRVYEAPDLREHVLNAVLVETARGIRLAKEKASRKVDGAVALAMSAWGAMEYGGRAIRESTSLDPLGLGGPSGFVSYPGGQRDGLAALYGRRGAPDYAVDKKDTGIAHEIYPLRR